MINKKDILNDELIDIYLDYFNIEQFILNHNKIKYVDFDYYVVNDFSLFINFPDVDFEFIEKKINKIFKTLKAINNIFAKPLLHLSEELVLAPIEAVKHIDKETFSHIYSHSELWDNIEDNNIKPYKLQTRIYQDNYSIYENLVFCNVIDQILFFIRRNLRLLKDLVLTKQLIELNLLDRTNHLNYFLALGKLHTGYVRYYDKFSDNIQNIYNKLNTISDAIIPKLKRPVYKKNKKIKKNIRLHKTNILSMHKDYRQIYSLAKSLNETSFKNDLTNDEIPDLLNSYFNYCQILTIFSIGHFNFTFGNKKIDFLKLNMIAKFKNWELKLYSKKKYNTIHIDINADKLYKIVLIPYIDKLSSQEEVDKLIKKIKEKIIADEYVVITPHEKDESLLNEAYISICSIDSFRRIQQLILKALIISDMKRIDCPFCAKELYVNQELTTKKSKTYTCNGCKTNINDTFCEKTEKKYTFTNIHNLHGTKIKKDSYSKNDMWMYSRKLESQMHFRNITNLNDNMEIICPYCNEVHK